MKLERTTRAPSPTAPLLLLALAGAVGCKAYPTHEPVPLDCSIEDRYEILMLDPFDTVGIAMIWSSSDFPDAGVPMCSEEDFTRNNVRIRACVEPIAGEPRCGSTAALVIRARENNDWGAVAGYNTFGPRDLSMYEGVSFWARAPGPTGKSFTVGFDDWNTVDPTPFEPPPASSDSNCTARVPDGGADAAVVQPGGTIIDPGTGMVIGGGTAGESPRPSECGNVYNANVIVTADWQFYTVPFSDFQQTASPNRVPNPALTQAGAVPGTGLLTSKLRNLLFRVPKEQDMDLWLDNFGFYRRRTADGGSDGGADAP
jgi:hypothetical protein